MLTAKFLRTHTTVAGSLNFNWFMRAVYEFWGFCVNGSNSLTAPGGFSPDNGVFMMPTGWESGSNVLLASGTDGFTTTGQPFFNSLSSTAFSASWVNKWITTWQSGSTSTDDSIYQITQWLNSSSVRVNVLQGGTPYTGSLHPSFSSRSSVNWRIIDFAAASALSISYATSSLILQFNGAQVVNPGSALCQVQITPTATSNALPNYYGPVITMSPSGSWGFNSSSVGSTSSWCFTDPTSQLFADTSGNGWLGTELATGTVQTYITLIGAQDFLIAHFKNSNLTDGSGFHIEIPQRLYPQGDDPNLIAGMIWGNNTIDSNTLLQNYGGGFYMFNPPTDSTFNYLAMARRFVGSDGSTGAANLATNGRLNGAYFNTFQSKFLFTDIVLAQPTIPGQYQMARARLRRARLVPTIIPNFQRVGNNGEWLHITNGIMWPWDNSLLPYNLLLGGV